MFSFYVLHYRHSVIPLYPVFSVITVWQYCNMKKPDATQYWLPPKIEHLRNSNTSQIPTPPKIQHLPTPDATRHRHTAYIYASRHALFICPARLPAPDQLFIG